MLRSFILLALLLALSPGGHAQLCQGSLGDPIINIDFGQGPNPGPPLSAATTNYQFVGTDCPQDGFYTMRTNSLNCYGNTWHTLQQDHTGNANGYMMLVNASFQPSAFYVDTVRGLCGNTNYEFAAWVINLLVPTSCNGATIQPNLTFRIERTNGTEIAVYNTNNIPPLSSPLWKQYGFNFTTPASGEDIVLRIINNAQGGCGNDIAIDDITFRACGPLLVPSIAGHPSLSDTLCAGEPETYIFTCTLSGGFNSPALQWQQQIDAGPWTDITGENGPTLIRGFTSSTPVGKYSFRLAVAEAGSLSSPKCRIVSSSLNIRVFPLPVVVATNNGPVCMGETVALTGTGATVYTWSGPNGFLGSGSPLSLPQANMEMMGEYRLTGVTAAGCVGSGLTSLVVNSSPVAQIVGGDRSICSGDSARLSATGGGTYRWVPATGLSAASVQDPWAFPGTTTVYTVVVENAFQCTDSASITISVIDKPIVSAGPDRTILEGESIQLQASVNGSGNSVLWSPPLFIDDLHSLSPVVNPTEDIIYFLQVVSNQGCGSATDSVSIKVYKEIFIPGAFTPNGDGLNDTWNIPALAAYSNFKLTVYNRWGQRVFNANNVMVPWNGMLNGKPLPAGAYHYILDTGQRQDLRKGSVILIR